MPIYFQRLATAPFNELVFRFAALVLSKVVQRQATKMPEVDPETELGLSPETTSAVMLAKVEVVEAKMLQYKSQLDAYFPQVEARQQMYEKECEQLEMKLEEFANFRSASFLRKVNEKLENDLKEATDYLTDITKALKSNPSVVSKGTSGCLDNSLLVELEQVDKLAKFIKSKL